MAKEAYGGLDIVFIPVNPEDVIVTSTCPPVSTQYYVTNGLGECNSEYPPEEGAEVGYSYNYFREPEGVPVT